MPGNWNGVTQSLSIGNLNHSDATHFFEIEFNRLIASEARNTSNIIVSNTELANELRTQIDTVSSDITSSIHNSNKILDSRLVELIWLIEQQGNEIITALNKIYQVLSQPNATEAKEFRNRGNKAYLNGWFQEAEQEFLKSIEKNPYDFSVYHSLGNVYLFNPDSEDSRQQIQNYYRAAECYKKAIKYAKPYSEDFAAFSAIHLAQSYYFLKDYESAYAVTLDLTRQSPDFLEARYLHAQYCVLSNRNDEAVENIIVLIMSNISYALFVTNDPVFSPIRPEIEKICQTLIRKYKLESDDLIAKIDSYIRQSKRDRVSETELVYLKNRYDHIIERYYNDNSLLGYYFTPRHLKRLYIDLLEALKQIWVNKEKDVAKLKTKKIPNILDGIVCTLLLSLSFILYVYGFVGGGFPPLSKHSVLGFVLMVLLFWVLGFLTIIFLNKKLIRPMLSRFVKRLPKCGLEMGSLLQKDELISPTNRNFNLLPLSWATLPLPLLLVLYHYPGVTIPMILDPPVLSLIIYQVFLLFGILLIGMPLRAILLSYLIRSGFRRNLADELIINKRLKNFEREISAMRTA